MVTKPSENPDAEERARHALEEGVAEVHTPSEAAKTLDALEKYAGNLLEEEVDQALPDASPEQQATALEAAGDVPAASKPVSVIEEAANQAANASAEEKPIVNGAVSGVMGGDESHVPSEEVRRGRSLLRAELLHRLGPLQAVDTFLFIQINQLPHTPLADNSMKRLSWVMTGGMGWFILLAAATLVDRRRGWKATLTVAPALWLATATVEHPIKKWFRRKRPFVSLVQAIIVGRKPGSYSFPSGHSAAAFAGALLLARQYPGGSRGFFGLAALVGFTRIYLGAHYPGDVLSGSFMGMVLARFYAGILRKIGLSPKP